MCVCGRAVIKSKCKLNFFEYFSGWGSMSVWERVASVGHRGDSRQQIKLLAFMCWRRRVWEGWMSPLLGCKGSAVIKKYLLINFYGPKGGQIVFLTVSRSILPSVQTI